MARPKSEDASLRRSFKDAAKSVLELHKMRKTLARIKSSDLIEETLNSFEQAYTQIKDQLQEKPEPSEKKKLKKAAPVSED